MTGKRDPWMKFYFTDWRAEPRLKLVSRAGRSLWLDMLGIMHEADPYGFLLIEGMSPTNRQLAGLVGDNERNVTKWCDELKAAGVFSIVGESMPDDVLTLIPLGLPQGTILCRRMLRDAVKRARDRDNGKRGGNPQLASRLEVCGVIPRPKPQYRERESTGLTPRSHTPETKVTPLPPSVSLNPTLAHESWIPWRDRAVSMFGKAHCERWLFPCALVPIAKDEMVLETPNKLHLSRVAGDTQRLLDLTGKFIRPRITAPIRGM
jgi:hypothetical protein